MSSSRSQRAKRRMDAKGKEKDYSFKAPYCEGEGFESHPYGCKKIMNDHWCVSKKGDCNFTANQVYGKKKSKNHPEYIPESFDGQEESQAIPEEESQAIPEEDYHSPSNNNNEPGSDGYGKTAYNVAHGLWEGAKFTGKIGLGIGKGLWWTGKQGASVVNYISDKVAEADEEAERARLVAEAAERKAQLLKEEEERLRNLRHKKNLREGKYKWHRAKEVYLPEEAQYLEYIDNIADASYISEEYTDERERADVRDFPKKGPTYGYMPGWDELPSGAVPRNNRHRRYKAPRNNHHRRYKAPPKIEKKNIDQEFLEHLREATRGLGEETQYKRHRHIRNTPATMDIEEDPKVERVKTTMDIEYEPEINIEKLDDNELDELVEWLESEIKENNTKGFSEEDFKSQKGGKCKKHGRYR